MKKRGTAITEQEQKFTSVELVCQGRGWDGKDLYVILWEPGTDVPGTYNLTKNTARFKTGARYSVPKQGGTILPSQAKYLGLWESEKERAMWEAKTDVANAEAALEKRHKRETERSPALLTYLKPFREEYFKTISSARRLALELALLKALRTPLKPGE